MKEIKLYREDNGQYSTSEARQDDVSGSYVQKTDYDELVRENAELKLALGIASAFPVKVRMECRKVIDSKLVSLDFAHMLHDSANRAISESSCEQLAGIKSDAVNVELEKLVWVIDNALGAEAGLFITEYAENLRKE
tara:strand:+ start:279 stop:689 length:411 start_codon:yes stop_codon:yes gene_type:complete